MKNVLRSMTLTTVLLFAVSVIAGDKVVVVPLGGKKPTGDAIAADVLEGKTFSNKDDINIVGTLPTKTLGPASTNVPAGYYNSTTLNGVDSDLASGNIHKDKNIFGIQGDTNVVDTSTGDALNAHILKDKKAWVDGVERTGTTGLFWGCSPGETHWSETTCTYACGAAIPGVFCSGFCGNLYIYIYHRLIPLHRT